MNDAQNKDPDSFYDKPLGPSHAPPACLVLFNSTSAWNQSHGSCLSFQAASHLETFMC